MSVSSEIGSRYCEADGHTSRGIYRIQDRSARFKR